MDRKTIHVITTKDNLRGAVGETYSTARLGRKWLNELEPGEVVNLCVCEKHGGPCEVVGTARIESLEYLLFDELDYRHVSSNHSVRSSASYNDLLGAMERAYGDKFSPNSPVTVIFYERSS